MAPPAPAGGSATGTAAQAPSHYDTLRLSLDGFKKALSRQINKANALITSASANPPSTERMQELRIQLGRTRGTFERMEHSCISS